jgi:hypothetical protein
VQGLLDQSLALCAAPGASLLVSAHVYVVMLRLFSYKPETPVKPSPSPKGGGGGGGGGGVVSRQPLSKEPSFHVNPSIRELPTMFRFPVSTSASPPPPPQQPRVHHVKTLTPPPVPASPFVAQVRKLLDQVLQEMKTKCHGSKEALAFVERFSKQAYARIARIGEKDL